MWLHDLKQANRKARNTAAFTTSPADALHNQPQGLNRRELERLAQKTRELREELTATIRHVDPSEYSEERIQLLLARVRQK